MITIRLDNSGDNMAKAMLKKSAGVKTGVGRAVQRSAIDLVGRVIRKLTDDVLKVRTGRLRRSITYVFREDNSGATAIVGTNLKYAAIHEYGFKGTVNVRAHARMQTMAFGKPMKEPRMVAVREHGMNMNMPERSFLRSALKEGLPTYQANIRKAIVEALKA